MGRQKLQQDLVFRLRADIAQLEKGLKKGRKQISGFQKSVKSVGQSMIGAFAGIAVIQGIGNAIKGIAKLEQAIRRVALTAKGGEKQFAALAKQLGGSTKFTSLESAEAMQFLAQAGFSVNEILTATPGVLNLAAASLMDLGMAADIASNIMSGFGINASEMNRVADILVTTTDSANTNVEQLGEAFKLVAPIARSAGISINDAAGFIGVLGDAGLQGTIAGTQLKGAIAALINPTAKGEKVLRRLGVTVSMTSDGGLDLTKTLEDLKKAGLTTKDAFQLFNKISAAGALVMAEGTEKARELSIATEEVGTSAAKAAGLMDTLVGDTDKLSSSWDKALKQGSVLNKFFRFLTQGATAYTDALSGSGIFFKKRIDLDKELINWSLKLRSTLFEEKEAQRLVGEAINKTTEEIEEHIKTIKKTVSGLMAITTLEAELTKRKNEAAQATKEELVQLELERVAREKVAKALEKEALATAKVAQAENARRTAQSPGTSTVLGGLEGLREFAPILDTTGIKLKEIVTTFEGFKETGTFAASIVGNAFQGMSNVITNALDSTENIFQAFGKFFGNFIKGMIIKLVAATVAAVALTAVLSLLGVVGGAGIANAAGGVSTFKSALLGNIGKIGGFADGGVSSGGLAMVGERGKELVAMPQGTRVLSHQQTVNAASGGGNMVIIPDVRIKGEDIWLSFTEANRKLGNTRG